jgi:hypothetical protein
MLADDVLIEERLDLRRLGQVDVAGSRFGSRVLLDDVLADGHALVADKHGWTRDQFPDVVLALIAKRTSQDIAVIFLQVGFPPEVPRYCLLLNQFGRTSGMA